jgi:hypothetical protein
VFNVPVSDRLRLRLMRESDAGVTANGPPQGPQELGSRARRGQSQRPRNCA